MSSLIFALDIGTRSVVGTILQEFEGKHHVLDLLSIEHEERAMIDGQIHNISDVAEVIIKIKTQLEEKHGPLKKVSVAAAGRALVTEESVLSIDLTQNTISSTEELHQLELATVQQAQQNLSSKNNRQQNDLYYCVGYSVLHYMLDDQKIGNLVDQTGRNAAIHVIATFLPQVVVESLLAALQRAGLEMTALTLEPIAAIHVLVPPSMRKLNIALVDIGAGTSDIAIAKDNTIIAYGMVPLAGDEVTDSLSQEYLIDFPVAETIKRQLHSQDSVEIEDILGFSQQVPTTEVCSQIDATIESIATSIAREIKRLNHEQAPKAVILVGGGSLTPGLPNKLSQALQLPEMRVGIRGLEALNQVTISEDFGQSPELVTPIGIAIAAEHAPLHYMTVTVNGQSIRLFELNEVTVGDAIIASNFSIDQMIGKPGRGITITIDGEMKLVPGKMGRSATIYINNKQATMKTPIKSGDQIKIEGGVHGADAQPLLKDLLSQPHTIKATINEKPIFLDGKFYINGEESDIQTQIQDRDVIETVFPNRLETVLKNEQEMIDNQSFSLTIDNKPIRLKSWETRFLVNDAPVNLTYRLQDGDEVTIQKPIPPKIDEIAATLEIPFFQKMTVFFNDKAIQIEKPAYQVIQDGEVVSHDISIQRGDRIELRHMPNNCIVFSDIFAFIDYELPHNVTGSYQLIRNDLPIQLNDEIFHNDRLHIKFD